MLAGRSEVGRTFLEWLGLARLPAERHSIARRPWRPIVVHARDGAASLGYLRTGTGPDRAKLMHFKGQIPVDVEVNVSSVAGESMRLTMTGLPVGPMLDDAALDPLGATRVAVRVEALGMAAQEQLPTQVAFAAS